jgi:hypothetical protein
MSNMLAPISISISPSVPSPSPLPFAISPVRAARVFEEAPESLALEEDDVELAVNESSQELLSLHSPLLRSHAYKEDSEPEERQRAASIAAIKQQQRTVLTSSPPLSLGRAVDREDK